MKSTTLLPLVIVPAFFVTYFLLSSNKKTISIDNQDTHGDLVVSLSDKTTCPEILDTLKSFDIQYKNCDEFLPKIVTTIPPNQLEAQTTQLKQNPLVFKIDKPTVKDTNSTTIYFVLGTTQDSATQIIKEAGLKIIYYDDTFTLKVPTGQEQLYKTKLKDLPIFKTIKIHYSVVYK